MTWLPPVVPWSTCGGRKMTSTPCVAVKIPNTPTPRPRRPGERARQPLFRLRLGHGPGRGRLQPPVAVPPLELLHAVRVDDDFPAHAVALKVAVAVQVTNGLLADAQPACSLGNGK